MRFSISLVLTQKHYHLYCSPKALFIQLTWLVLLLMRYWPIYICSCFLITKCKRKPSMRFWKLFCENCICWRFCIQMDFANVYLHNYLCPKQIVSILSEVISFVWNYRINSEQNKFNCLKAFLVCSSCWKVLFYALGVYWK